MTPEPSNGECSYHKRARTYTLDAYHLEGVGVFDEIINQLPADEAQTLATAIPPSRTS
jgi:hypothetical protein